MARKIAFQYGVEELEVLHSDTTRRPQRRQDHSRRLEQNSQPEEGAICAEAYLPERLRPTELYPAGGIPLLEPLLVRPTGELLA